MALSSINYDDTPQVGLYLKGTRGVCMQKVHQSLDKDYYNLTRLSRVNLVGMIGKK